jgi:putative endopeptidase
MPPSHSRSRKRRHARSRHHTRKRPTPCALADDFYGVYNDAWRAATSIPATESRVTRAYYISEDVYREIDDVIADAAADSPLKLLQQSWDHTAAAPSRIPAGISPILLMLLNMTTREELSGAIGWLNRHSLPAPFGIFVQSDPRENSRCRIAIEESYPMIGNTDYWTLPRYRGHRRAYAAYVDRLAAATALPALRQGFSVEREYTNLYPSASEKKKVDMISLHELETEFGNIDWVTLLTAAGVPAEHQRTTLYNVLSRPYLHRINRRFVEWSPARWGAWMALLVTQGLAGTTPAGPLREAWFTYKRRFLQGIPADLSPAQLRTAILRYLLPDTVSRLWVRKHCDPALRRTMRSMTETIRAAGLEALATTEWMAPSTRRAAREKLRRLDIQLCWPEPWPHTNKEMEFATGELSPTDFIHNLLLIGEAKTREYMGYLGRAAGCARGHEDGWGEAPFQANAFYYPNRNRFLLPAGILRPPFYDPAASLATNYGGIGATIGHELCHAFDSEGRLYDAEGNTRSWWTASDGREYKKRALAMVRLFSSARYRGMRVDGQLTLTENIADLAGLEFALAGLRRALGREPRPEELREFFVSYAVSWRSKDRLRRAAQLLDTDYHAPPMLRVNQIVRQFEDWYVAFGVGPECAGYIPPEKRIRFFS